MKQVYLKCLILGILSFLCINVLAYDCKVNGIYYNLNETAKTASVTYAYYNSGSNSIAYEGDVSIPSTFMYKGTEYMVAGIGDYAFYYCIDLTSVEIPSSVTTIGLHAFDFCDKLSSVTIPNSVVTIGKYAFSGCKSLTTVNVPNGLECIEEYTFFMCESLTSIIIPNSVTSIGQDAFGICGNLTTITIPNSVISIGYNAFRECNLETVYSEITDVFESYAFSGNENATLYVPHGLAVTYRTTPGWNVFKYIEEMKSEEDLEDFLFLLSCNSKGSVTINGTTEFTNKIGVADVFEDTENTFVFTPKANCKLEQVCLNGFDITLSVEDNTLKAVVPSNSQMIVTFAKEAGDLNNDGKIDISDVVSLVNIILGQ